MVTSATRTQLSAMNPLTAVPADIAPETADNRSVRDADPAAAMVPVIRNILLDIFVHITFMFQAVFTVFPRIFPNL